METEDQMVLAPIPLRELGGTLQRGCRAEDEDEEASLRSAGCVVAEPPMEVRTLRGVSEMGPTAEYTNTLRLPPLHPRHQSKLP